MAVTPNYSWPVPVNTDLVKDGAVAIETLGDAIDSSMAYMVRNNQVGTTYTFTLADVTKLVTASNAAARTYTIPPQADIVWVADTIIKVTNLGVGVVTFAAGAGVTVTNTASTLAQYQTASLIRTASNTWVVVPFFGGGVSLLSDSAISGTTGSPTTATYTSGGINYKTYSFTGSGSITLSTAGLVDVLAIAGGAGAGGNLWGGGGGGGAVITTQIYLPIAAHAVTVGAGGSQGSVGREGNYGYPSVIGLATDTLYLASVGGGGGGSGDSQYGQNGVYGASGGGGGAGSYLGSGGGVVLTGLGNLGGDGNGTLGGGGGGGAGGVGTQGSGANVGGNGGAGISNTFRLGTSVTYGGGGLGNGSPAGTNGAGGGGTANTGGGGGYAAGGSGLVVIRVKA